MAVEILSGLWLCDLNAVTHDLVKRRTDLFVSVCKTDISQYKIFTRDICDKMVVLQRVSLEHGKILPLIDQYVRKSKTVTVFCETGHQRSASLVAMYLILFAKLSAEASIRCIRSKSAEAFDSGCIYSTLLKQLENSSVCTSTPW